MFRHFLRENWEEECVCERACERQPRPALTVFLCLHSEHIEHRSSCAFRNIFIVENM